MNAWRDFWAIAMALSSAAFAAITVIVAVRGGRELIAMFRTGRARRPHV